MKEWWHNLSERERNMVSVAGTVLIIFILYIFVWNPFNNSIDTKKSQLKQQIATLGWMQENKNAVLSAHSRQRPRQKLTPDDLLAYIDGSVHKANFANYGYNLKQSGSESLKLTFKQIPFDDFISWLTTQVRTTNIIVLEMSATSLNQQGIVSINAALSVRKKQ